MNPALMYIDTAPEPFRGIMMHLHASISLAFPDVLLKYKWRLPFYYLDEKTMFCFLNYRGTFVDLGMPYAAQLTDLQHLLVAGEQRKMMRSLRFYKLDEINDALVLQTLQDLYALRYASKK